MTAELAAPAPIGWRTLQHDVRTPIGCWPAGLQVIALRVRVDGRIRICLDNLGEHPNGRCHAVTVPRAWLSQLARNGHLAPVPAAPR